MPGPSPGSAATRSTHRAHFDLSPPRYARRMDEEKICATCGKQITGRSYLIKLNIGSAPPKEYAHKECGWPDERESRSAEDSSDADV